MLLTFVCDGDQRLAFLSLLVNRHSSALRRFSLTSLFRNLLFRESAPSLAWSPCRRCLGLPGSAQSRRSAPRLACIAASCPSVPRPSLPRHAASRHACVALPCLGYPSRDTSRLAPSRLRCQSSRRQVLPSLPASILAKSRLHCSSSINQNFLRARVVDGPIRHSSRLSQKATDGFFDSHIKLPLADAWIAAEKDSGGG